MIINQTLYQPAFAYFLGVSEVLVASIIRALMMEAAAMQETTAFCVTLIGMRLKVGNIRVRCWVWSMSFVSSELCAFVCPRDVPSLLTCDVSRKAHRET
jgi:hypothetical protein